MSAYSLHMFLFLCCFCGISLTFAGRLWKIVVKTNAVLSAQTMIYTVLQTGITGELQVTHVNKDRDAERFNSLASFIALCTSWSFICNKIAAIPTLLEADEQQTYHIEISVILSRGDMRAAVGTPTLCLRRTWLRISVRNDMVWTAHAHRLAEHLPVCVSRQFGGVCNTSLGSSKTQTSTEREKGGRRKERGLILEQDKLHEQC